MALWFCNKYPSDVWVCTLWYHPNEALTREQAVIAYTAGSAYAEMTEKQKGTLVPGMLADLAVLSQDIFTIPLDQLPAVRSVLTMVGGSIVYQAEPH